MSNIENLIAEQTYRVEVFPHLLAAMEEADGNYTKAAELLNASGIRSYRGKEFSKQNLRALFTSYYEAGPYSHSAAKEALEVLRSYHLNRAA